LSAMTAAATQIFLGRQPEQSTGTNAIGHRRAGDPTTQWRAIEVGPFIEVPVEGRNGWQVRLSPSVDRRKIGRGAGGERV
ncbi:hypothetical protein ACCS75_35585, partial [Rhizobium ruizarguesonis]